MKKVMEIIMLIIFSFLLMGCQHNRQPDDAINHQDESELVIPSSYILPEKFYRDIDLEYYRYATVMIQTPYRYPSQDIIDREAIKSYYEEHHFEYIEEHQLNQWQYHDIYSSTYSPLIMVSYSSKQRFFHDFELIKALQDPSTTITIELNTIGETIILNPDSSIDDLLNKADDYRERELTFPSIDFDVIDINLSIDDDPIFDDLGYQSTLIIDSFEDYQQLFIDDRYQLRSSFFDQKMLIVMISHRSSSQSIMNVSGIYERNGHVDVALRVEQISQLMTSDVIRYVVVTSVNKEDLDPSASLELILHTHYLDGYLSEVPFYINQND
ncbi:MAG TPA: hypothetical protein PLP48_07690 [Acholeplasmataceae bacterium]|nr:hypothetical protein [Acholeplasmataceae bacterium]